MVISFLILLTVVYLAAGFGVGFWYNTRPYFKDKPSIGFWIILWPFVLFAFTCWSCIVEPFVKLMIWLDSIPERYVKNRQYRRKPLPPGPFDDYDMTL